MKQAQLLLQNDVINGFSYSFTSTLTSELHKMFQSGEVFKNKALPLKSHTPYPITDIANTIISYLSEQLHFPIPNGLGDFTSSEDYINQLLYVSKTFLAIFEENS